MEQPALAEDKYTRGVIYKIDQKKMTVEQIWEVGKDLRTRVLQSGDGTLRL